MAVDFVGQVEERALRQLTLIAGVCAFGISAEEKEPAPRFQLDTAIRFGITDEDANRPAVIKLMRDEYRAWITGNALAGMSEAIATMLDEFVVREPDIWQCGVGVDRFKMRGLEKKLAKLPRLNIDADLLATLQDVTAVRNCLVHRHGIVGPDDRLLAGHLSFRYRAYRVFVDSPNGLIELDDAHRGPAAAGNVRSGQLRCEPAVLSFPTGSRVALRPGDFSSVQCTMQECATAIARSARGWKRKP